MSRAVKGLDTRDLSRGELRRISRLASKSFPTATGNGIWGIPRGPQQSRGTGSWPRLLQICTKNVNFALQAALESYTSDILI